LGYFEGDNEDLSHEALVWACYWPLYKSFSLTSVKDYGQNANMDFECIFDALEWKKDYFVADMGKDFESNLAEKVKDKPNSYLEGFFPKSCASYLNWEKTFQEHNLRCCVNFSKNSFGLIVDENVVQKFG
jgi:hypothetical protein